MDGFFDCRIEYLFSLREGDLPTTKVLRLRGGCAQLLLELLEVDTQLLQDGDSNAATVLQYPQEDMLGPEIFMMIALGLFPR
jgi:hypothetical protein